MCYKFILYLLKDFFIFLHKFFTYILFCNQSLIIKFKLIINNLIIKSYYVIFTSPTYFWTNSEPITRIKQASVLLATALAHKVLPVPGGPNNNTPLGGSIPKLTNFSGYNK